MVRSLFRFMKNVRLTFTVSGDTLPGQSMGRCRMEETTKLVREEIQRRYGSLMGFSRASSIPYSTLTHLMNRGIEHSSHGVAMQVLELLEIHSAERPLTADAREILRKIGCLDERGLHTVQTVLQMEYDRCAREAPEENRSFHGVDFSDDRERERIRKVVQEVLTERRR